MRCQCGGRLMGTLLIMLSMLASGAMSQTAPSLKGLKGVAVEIGGVDPEMQSAGVSAEQLLADAKLRLHQHGIRVLPTDQDAPGHPKLVIKVFTYKIQSSEIEGFAYNVSCELRQDVVLRRNSNIAISATTWEKGMVGAGSHSGAQQHFRQVVSDVVDLFAADYIEENP